MDTRGTGQGQGESTSQTSQDADEEVQSTQIPEEGRGSRVEDSSGTDAREVEWQFDAAEFEPIEEWLGGYASGQGFKVGSGQTKNLTDTYYDTGGWMLYRAGYTLRIRQRGKSAEATMKSIAPAADGIRQRREISESLDDGELSTLRKSGGKVGERLRVLAGSADLEKLFEVRTRRRAFDLLFEQSGGAGDGSNGESKEGPDQGPAEARVFGEIALDETEIPLGRGEEPARLRRVEIEALPEAITRDLRHFVEDLRSSYELSSTRVSKFEAGLYTTGLVPDDQTELGPTRIDSSMTTGEVAYAVLRGQFAALQHHEPGVRLGEDPEEVHDMRVASRRLRTAIKLFSQALPERALWLEGELSWIAGALGEVRDLDVELAELRAWDAGERDAGAFHGLIEAVEGQHSQARERMLAALDSGRYGRLTSSLAAMLRRGPAGSNEENSKADTPIIVEAPELLARRYKKFRKAAEGVTGDAPVEAYHELRKKGKSLRYALEFHREIYGSPVKRLIRTLKSLQDDLGRHQDAVVAAEQLRELGTAEDQGLPNDTVFAIGAYAERYRREAAELRARIPKSKAFRTLHSRATQKELRKDLEKKADKKRR